MAPSSPVRSRDDKVVENVHSVHCKKQCMSYKLPPSNSKPTCPGHADRASHRGSGAKSGGDASTAKTPELSKKKRFVVHYSPARMLDFDNPVNKVGQSEDSKSERENVSPNTDDQNEKDINPNCLWELGHLPDGRPYWYNSETGESSWSKPYRSIEMKHPRSTSYTWIQYQDQNSCPYYYNPATNEVVWSKPFKSMNAAGVASCDVVERLRSSVTTIEDLDSLLADLILQQPKEFGKSLKALEKLRARRRLRAISAMSDTPRKQRPGVLNAKKRIQALPSNARG